MRARAFIVMVLAACAGSARSVSYVHSTSCSGDVSPYCVNEMDLSLCSYLVEDHTIADPIRRCVTEQPILNSLRHYEGTFLDEMLEEDPEPNGAKATICEWQLEVCSAIHPEEKYGSECMDLVGNCRSALRHLQEMMFKEDGTAQVCNNFARKSIRGFFHDQMSNHIDGSILSEGHVQHNFGLCRWSQYMNVLSDHTRCDPGTAIAMAGMLGYEACGVKVWEFDLSNKPMVTVGRPYPCGTNYENNDAFNDVTGQRQEAFSDTQLSTNATAMEEFWYAINDHGTGAGRTTDGEVEYSAEAAAAAHAVGRVTCAPDGLDNEGVAVGYSSGFFHKPDVALTAEQNFMAGSNRIRSTQCLVKVNAAGEVSQLPTPQGRRIDQAEAAAAGAANAADFGAGAGEGETTINTEAGFCGMPTQFLGTVNVGGKDRNHHRIPRWLSGFENSAKVTSNWSPHQSPCRESVKLYLPAELLTLRDTVSLPSSNALDRFRDIAWDRVDRIDSAWDSCEVGCTIPIADSHLCGGTGLEEFDWTKAMCSDGTMNGYACCAGGAVDACNLDAIILAGGVECTASWSVDCVVPRKNDGAACAADEECKRGSCKGGRCCNALAAAETECGTCGAAGGGCVKCTESHKFQKRVCVTECTCSEGCSDCDCGVCSKCGSGHYLTDGVCLNTKPAGSECAEHAQCSSGACRGGYCCDLEQLAKPNSNLAKGGVAAGCTACNSRGLCAVCAEGYTRCGTTIRGGDGGNYGQCFEDGGEQSTYFRCGGEDGGSQSWPSTDGFNYCETPVCPCPMSACYIGCLVKDVCWDASIAATLTSYAPEFAGPDQDDKAWFADMDSRTTKQGCDWVAEDPGSRCTERRCNAAGERCKHEDDVTAKEACRATCAITKEPTSAVPTAPTTSGAPSAAPTSAPSEAPTSAVPSVATTAAPTYSPTSSPSTSPDGSQPFTAPSSDPTAEPSTAPTDVVDNLAAVAVAEGATWVVLFVASGLVLV